MTCPACLHATTFGIPDEYAGEVLRTYVVPKLEVADAVMNDSRWAARVKAKLYETVAGTAAKYKRLDGGVEFVDTIPKNPSGKIIRRVLREHSARSQSSTKARARL